MEQRERVTETEEGSGPAAAAQARSHAGLALGRGQATATTTRARMALRIGKGTGTAKGRDHAHRFCRPRFEIAAADAAPPTVDISPLATQSSSRSTGTLGRTSSAAGVERTSQLAIPSADSLADSLTDSLADSSFDNYDALALKSALYTVL